MDDRYAGQALRRNAAAGRSRPSFFANEWIPIANAIGVPDQRRHGELRQRSWRLEELESHFVRQAISLLGIDRLARPNAVFPRVLPSAGTRNHVVDVPFLRLEQCASVLATISIALANALGAKLRALFRHAGKVRQHDHRRHTNRTTHGVDRSILLANRQPDPFVPPHGTDTIFTFDFESGRHTGGHLAKGLCRRPNVDRLPVPIQDQDRCSVDYAVHTSVFPSAIGRTQFFRAVFVLVVTNGCRPWYCPRPLRVKAGCAASTPAGKMVAREGYAPSIAVCKTAVILFHHRALKMAAGDGFAPSTSLSESDELLATPSRIKNGSPGENCTHIWRLKRPLFCC